jgi:hypothetical protein
MNSVVVNSEIGKSKLLVAPSMSSESKPVNSEIEKSRLLVLSVFGYDIYMSLISFGNKIKNEEADLIILIARKAVFFYRILKDIGFNFGDTQIVSDRIMDFDKSFFVGKRIVLVDDSTILGTTAEKTIKTLKEEGKAASVRFFSFTVDLNYIKPEVLNKEIDYIQRKYGKDGETNEEKKASSSNQLLSFCLDEIKYVSTLSLPYIIDFPVSDVFKVTNEKWVEIKATLQQKFVITNLPTHSDYNDVSAFACYPKPELKSRLIQEIGQNFYDRFIYCGKLRLYKQDLRDGQIALRIVPLFLFTPFANRDAKMMFDEIIKGNYNKHLERLKQNKAIYRFVQYYLSYSLGLEYLKYAGLTFFYDKETRDITFGKDVSDAIEQIQFAPSQLQSIVFSKVVNFEYNDFSDILERNGLSSINDERLFDNSFAEIFTNLFRKRELEARKGNVFYMNRLKHGLSFDQLLAYYKESDYFKNNKYFDGLTPHEKLSDLLDKYNDAGVSVPIICETEDGNAYYRAYRHGELALLTKKNADLYYYFLSEFFKDEKAEYKILPSTRLAKISVMFFYLGTQKHNFMCKYDNTKREDRKGVPFVNIGWDLHGAILTTDTKEKLSNDKGKWFFFNSVTKSLFFDDFTNPDDPAKQSDPYSRNYRLKLKKDYDLRNTPMKGEEIDKVKDIAYHLNVIYSNTKSNKESARFDAILTILASCSNVYALVYAILAEIEIFKKNVEVLFNEFKITPIENCFKKLTNDKSHSSPNQCYFKFKEGKDINKYCEELQENTKYEQPTRTFINSFKNDAEDANLLNELEAILTRFARVDIYINYLRIYLKAYSFSSHETIQNDSICTVRTTSGAFTFCIVDKKKENCKIIPELYGYASTIEINNKSSCAKQLKGKSVGCYTNNGFKYKSLDGKIDINVSSFSVVEISHIVSLHEEYKYFTKQKKHWINLFPTYLEPSEMKDIVTKAEMVIASYRNKLLNPSLFDTEIHQSVIAEIRQSIKNITNELSGDMNTLKQKINHYLNPIFHADNFEELSNSDGRIEVI